MNDSFLKFCKYYHGEAECPYPVENGKARHFWMLELQFANDVFGTSSYDFFLDLYKKVKVSDKSLAPIYQNESLPLEVRVFITYCAATYINMTGRYDYKYLLEYGK